MKSNKTPQVNAQAAAAGSPHHCRVTVTPDPNGNRAARRKHARQTKGKAQNGLPWLNNSTQGSDVDGR